MTANPSMDKHEDGASHAVIRFACPCCRRNLKAKPELVGKTLKCPACTFELTVPEVSESVVASASSSTPPYGLVEDFPIMAGMGPRGAARYFRHLRCPSGKEVTENRTGSVIQPDLSYVDKWHGRPCPMYGSKCPQGEMPLDVYELTCGCGEHKIDKVLVDKYHVVPDRCVGVEGWTFVDSMPHGKTLAAGESA